MSCYFATGGEIRKEIATGADGSTDYRLIGQSISTAFSQVEGCIKFLGHNDIAIACVALFTPRLVCAALEFTLSFALVSPAMIDFSSSLSLGYFYAPE